MVPTQRLLHVSYPVIKILTKVKYMCGSVISTMLTSICRVGKSIHFSEDSEESSNQEEEFESKGEQSNDADDMNYIDEPLERCPTSGM